MTWIKVVRTSTNFIVNLIKAYVKILEIIHYSLQLIMIQKFFKYLILNYVLLLLLSLLLLDEFL